MSLERLINIKPKYKKVKLKVGDMVDVFSDGDYSIKKKKVEHVGCDFLHVEGIFRNICHGDARHSGDIKDKEAL